MPPTWWILKMKRDMQLKIGSLNTKMHRSRPSLSSSWPTLACLIRHSLSRQDHKGGRSWLANNSLNAGMPASVSTIKSHKKVTQYMNSSHVSSLIAVRRVFQIANSKPSLETLFPQPCSKIWQLIKFSTYWSIISQERSRPSWALKNWAEHLPSKKIQTLFPKTILI